MTEPASTRRQHEQHEALLVHLRQQFQQRLDAGLVPLDGVWVERGEVEHHQQQQRRRSGHLLVELLLLNGVVALMGLALLFLAWAISA